MRACALVLTVLGISGAPTSHADDCEPLDPAAPAYGSILEALDAEVHVPPAEILVCRGDVRRWLARWDVLEHLDGWRKYASAFCRDDQPLYCRLRRHVAVADSHEVIDLPYDIPIPRVMELYHAARAHRPDAEVAAIEHTVVEDGGAWSEETYGYRIQYLERPDYAGGDIVTFRRFCDKDCAWRPRPRRDASWDQSSSAQRLRDERRKSGDPLLDRMPL